VFARALPALAVWCLRPGPRLVHVHTAVRGSLYRKAIVIALARALRRPVLVHLHAGVGDIAAFDERLGPWRRRLLAGALGMANRVVSVSAAGAAEIERRFGVCGVVVVPNAAPPAPPPGAPGAPGRGAIRILYIGGFDDAAKGGAVLLAALEPLLRAHAGVLVDVAGPGDAPAALLRLARSEPRVRWLGWLDEAAKHAAYRAADVVIFPSITEGLPVALLEAMAHGRAIIASRAGGMPEVLTHGEDAVLVPAGAPDALVAAIVCLAGDASERHRLGRAAAARTVRLNDVEVTGRLLALYRDALEAPLSPR
jgi:glycosyltransferase involved in cell wall biosynthesis